jgi:hypothetical protein
VEQAMMTAPKSEMVCCFCTNIKAEPPEPLSIGVQINVLEAKDSVQGLFAHVTCLKQRLDASVPLYILDAYCD